MVSTDGHTCDSPLSPNRSLSLEPLHANGLSWPSNMHCTFPRKASVTQMLTTKTAIEAPPALPRLPAEKIPMSLLLAALSAAGVLESAACSYLVAKLAGCWLRTLLHNNKLPFLRRRSMVHHLLPLGLLQPNQGQGFQHESAGSKRKRNANVR